MQTEALVRVGAEDCCHLLLEVLLHGGWDCTGDAYAHLL
jgi:hypothetical protein